MSAARADDPVLKETLDALAMPPHILEKWLLDRRSFCLAHGGRRHYAEVLDLVEECLRVMGRPVGDGPC